MDRFREDLLHVRLVQVVPLVLGATLLVVGAEFDLHGGESGGPGRTRTYDQKIMSLLL